MRKLYLVVLLLFLGLAFGCTTTQSAASKGASPSEAAQAPPPEPIYTETEFPDIVVPTELSLDRSKTLIVRTQDYVGGVLVVRGRVKARSVEEFFKNQLQARGWELVGSIYHNRNILLSFRRANGCCMIYITDSFNTEVQIWASETLTGQPVNPEQLGHDTPR